jgi:2-oxoisovalerate dehydrogenase E1 component
VLILHDDTLTGGIGGEISAFITENAFEYLDAPIRRLGSLDTPVPYAPTLEEEFLPNKNKVVKILKELLYF